MTLSQLNLEETLAAGAANAFLTSVFIGIVAGLIVKRYELRHQTRAALRTTYAQLLVAQRRSRQLSIELAQADRNATDSTLAKQASAAHDEFINVYHDLNLDVSRQMWREVRALRHILDDMLTLAQARKADECEKLSDLARAARQNLAGGFRAQLGHAPLQKRKPLGKYDKGLADSAGLLTRLSFRLIQRRSLWFTRDIERSTARSPAIHERR
ncbi:hypothetical protein [Streptomyces sp. Agncl-13]|uniref:hypothetical protein n=1 Tax=Streptomyces sp. Agncl-13 TaxID=3400628 RepID=UPI003A892A87